MAKVFGRCEVQGYWGDWEAGRSAYLKSFKTKRNGATVTRYRWEAPASAKHIGGTFITVERALGAAAHCPWARNVEPTQ